MVHDACLMLGKAGTRESVPALIYALKLRPPGYLEPGHKELVEDTTLHCAEALQTITGEDLGVRAAAWENWWVAQGNPPVPDPGAPLARTPTPSAR